MKWWQVRRFWDVVVRGFYIPERHYYKHPCPEAFRMKELDELGTTLLGLHIRNAEQNGGSWDR